MTHIDSSGCLGRNPAYAKGACSCTTCRCNPCRCNRSTGALGPAGPARNAEQQDVQRFKGKQKPARQSDAESPA